MLPNLDGEAAAHAQRRLDDATIIWLTTVGPGGQPQTSPVGYIWDGSRFLIISVPSTPKVRNLRANPKVAMHLDLDTTSEDYSVLTIEGVAEVDPAPAGQPARLSEEERAAYVGQAPRGDRLGGPDPGRGLYRTLHGDPGEAHPRPRLLSHVDARPDVLPSA